jgi:hypothetical protein
VRLTSHRKAAGKGLLTVHSQTAAGECEGTMSAALYRVEHLAYYLFLTVVVVTNITAVFHDSLHLF